MNKFFEAVSIALQAIWANKLRSLLTVLGNIVAVTSIIAVVSLVQGLNASVTEMIQTQFAPDAFTVSRTGMARTDEEAAARAEQSAHHDAGRRRDSPGGPDDRAGDGGDARPAAQIKYRGNSIDSVQIRGVTKEYLSIPSTSIERGRPITPSEFDTGRPVVILGWGTADRLFGAIDPLDKVVTIVGMHFRVVGVAPKKGAIFGQSQDEFVVMPLPALQRLFGSRLGLRLTVAAGRSDARPGGHGRHAGGAPDRAAAAAETAGQLRHRVVRDVPRHLSRRRPPACSRF